MSEGVWDQRPSMSRVRRYVDAARGNWAVVLAVLVLVLFVVVPLALLLITSFREGTPGRLGEWTLGLGGRIVGGSESAARVQAMLKRAAVMHEAKGTQIRLRCSPSLDQAAAAEVAAQGMTFEQFEAQLAQDLSLSTVADNGSNVRH